MVAGRSKDTPDTHQHAPSASSMTRLILSRYSGHWIAPHRQTRVAGLSAVDAIDRQKSDSVHGIINFRLAKLFDGWNRDPAGGCDHASGLFSQCRAASYERRAGQASSLRLLYLGGDLADRALHDSRLHLEAKF